MMIILSNKNRKCIYLLNLQNICTGRQELASSCSLTEIVDCSGRGYGFKFCKRAKMFLFVRLRHSLV